MLFPSKEHSTFNSKLMDLRFPSLDTLSVTKLKAHSLDTRSDTKLKAHSLDTLSVTKLKALLLIF